MSNRENLRRIAALSLVIAFGMSGAAGLANEQETKEVVAPASQASASQIVLIEYDGTGFTPDPNGEKKQTYSTSIAIPADKKEVIFELAKEWKFTDVTDSDNEIALDTIVKLDGDVINEDNGKYALKFTEERTYTVVISAEGVEDKITITFNVTKDQNPEDKPATPVYSELVINESAISDFSKDTESGNTYKYNGKFTTDENGNYTADFSSFWKFVVGDVDAKSVTDSTYIKENDGTYTFATNNFDENRVTFYAKGHETEDDAVLTLIFQVDKPEEVAPTVDIYSDIRNIYFDGNDETYIYEYRGDPSSTPDDPYTVNFMEFWTFTNPATKNTLGYIITDNDDKVIEPVDNEKPGATNEYAVTFPKTGEYKLLVKALKADGTTTYDAPVITLNFDIKSDVPELTIDGDKADADGFKIDGTTYTYELTLDEAGTAKDVEFTKFWKFDLNGAELEFALPEGIEKAEGGYKVSFDTAGEYPYEIKAIKTAADAETETAAVLYNAPVLTLKFVVTEAKPEITVDLTTNETEEFTEADDKFTFIGGFEETEDDEGNCKFTATFKPFWNFKLGEEAVAYAIYNEDVSVQTIEKDDENGTLAIDFTESGEHTYTVKAVNAEGTPYENAPSVTLVFDVPEHKVDRKLEIIADKKSDDFSGFDGDELYSGRYKQTVLEESALPYTVTFDKFWQFTADGEPVVEVNNIAEVFGDGVEYSVGEDGKCTLTFKSFGRYNIKMYADGHTAEDDDCLSIFFDISPIPEFNTDGDEWENYFSKDADKSEFTYKKDLTLSNGTCEAAFPTFWNFAFKDGYVDSNSTGGYIRPDTDLEGAEVSFNESDEMHHILFSKAGTYTFYVKAAGTFYDYDEPEVKLIFTVNPEPTRTDPPYIPSDPVTPAPTATPTATPAPTETPAPTDAPTDAPTSEPTVAPDVEMQVSAGGKRLNVRSGAGIGNSIIARLNDGSKVTVLLVEGDWSYIRATVNGNAIEGYVSSQYLKEISTVEPTEPTNARVSTSGSALRLRARASLNAPIITRMPNGSSLKVLETVNGWCRVQFTAANGTVHEGWASSQYITVIA